jgi:DeoR/GlpR family transcriptional regulator of sugar metabolism
MRRRPNLQASPQAPAESEGAASALRYDSAPARRTFIIDLVRNSGFCSASELSRELGVSEMTVRRDIQRLAREGLARAVHGGVSAIATLPGPIDFRLRAAQRLPQKRAIARAALSRLDANSVVAFDAGTTTLEAARLLPPDLRITAVTHSLPVIATLAARNSIEVIALGGALHAETQSFAGPITVRALADLRVHTLLLGATSVRDAAMWCTNTYDAAIKRALVAIADRVILLVDSAKFDVTAVMKVADLAEVDIAITDTQAAPQALAMFAVAGVETVMVGEESGQDS